MRFATQGMALLFDASLFGSRCLFLRLCRVDGFGLLLSGFLLVRFGGFVAHGFGGLVVMIGADLVHT